MEPNSHFLNDHKKPGSPSSTIPSVAMSFALNMDKAAEKCLRIFKDGASSIICGLPADIERPEAIFAIQVIAEQVGCDYDRLVFVNEAIQERVWVDASWATSTAADLYEILATTIDPELSVPHLPMKGALLARNEMMSKSQAQFEQMMSDSTWNRGLTNFLGQLCTTGKIISITPGITLHILDHMILSVSLTNENFDHLMSFLKHAGPFLDSHVPFRMLLTARLQQLRQRAQSLGVSSWLAVEGLVHLRECGWSREALQVEAMSTS